MIKCERFLKLNYGVKKFVVCPKCDSLYDFQDCILEVKGKKESKKCHHVFFPSKTQQCKSLLLKTILSSNCRQKFVPFKLYAYKSLRESIKTLAKKENFVDDCEKWRSRNTSPDTYGDIYDGDVWNSFSEFLKEPHHYLLMLNVDWFQPFSHIQYSVGAIYVVIQNLPRHKRFLEENIILVGVIPGPSEPKLTMNSYLAPLTEELREGWDSGFGVKTSRGINITVKVALSSVVCDIPASRKVSGFLSHNARFGCNKCYKDFSIQSSIGSSYKNRTRELHLEHLKEMEGVENKTQLHDIEKKYGVRFSILTTLPYFDPIEFTVIDPMHNLYLGTAKNVFKIWIKTGTLDKNHLALIEDKMKKFTVPYGIGRLPSNISSNFGGFTAVQWRIWVTVYSSVILKNVLPNEHLRCWLIFVQACKLIGNRLLKKKDITDAESYFKLFCKDFERLYGVGSCTPNMHLHMHLCKCFLDYGPPHAMWCFPFERYNGLLGSFHTNQKNIECQVMKTFQMHQTLKSSHFYLDPDIPNYFSKTVFACKEHESSQLPPVELHEKRLFKPLGDFLFSDLETVNCKPLPPYKERIFSSQHVDELKLMYSLIYPSESSDKFVITPFHSVFGRVSIQGNLIGSSLNGHSYQSGSVVIATWPKLNDNYIPTSNEKVVGVVQYYFTHYLLFSDNPNAKIKHMVARLAWKEPHPTRHQYFGISAIVSCKSEDQLHYCGFIPVQRIETVCAHCVYTIDTDLEEVFVACPLPSSQLML